MRKARNDELRYVEGVWVPRVSVARRCAAKLLTAHRGGGPELPTLMEIACVDTIAFAFVSRRLCRLIGKLWLEHGHAALAWEKSQTLPPLRASPALDAGLESVLKSCG